MEKIEILKYFPESIQKEISNQVLNDFEFLEEIRIRNNKPIILKYNTFEKITKHITSSQEILEILRFICENSVYSYQNQITQGFITIKGGHRVGITGSCVVEDSKIININYICSLNFRISRQVLGSSNDFLKHVLNKDENTIYNTLIVSPPGAGKTTLLRDLVRNIATGIEDFKPINVGIVDERGEIASLYKGIPQNDIGIKSDVIENINKSVGMKILIRSMSPNVIVADEIGTVEDVESINYAICSGIKCIFTAHGSSFEDLILNPILEKIIKMNVIEKIIILDEKRKGDIKKIYSINKFKKEYEENLL